MATFSKIAMLALLVGTAAFAQNAGSKVENFLKSEFAQNPRIKSVEVKVSDEVPLKDLKGWSAYILDVSAYLKDKPTEKVKQKMVWFSDGNIITKELVRMKDGENLAESVKPDMKKEHYAKANLIYGDANAKHKVAIFSDPLCPFCRGFVPEAIKEMQKEPKKFAIYYYHFPLARLHPAAVVLVQAAAAAELKGAKDVVLKLYSVEINERETDVAKIVAAFNKAVGTKLTPQDLQDPRVKAHLAFDQEVAASLMVGGTPTLYFDGKLDNTKKKYKSAK